MKKSFGLIILILVFTLFFTQFGLFAQDEKSIKAYAGLGYSFSDYEGPLMACGLEMQFANHLFAQFGVDFYPNPLPDAEDALDVNFTLLGINFEAIYKIFPSDTMSIFVKGGFHFIALRQKMDIEGVMFNSSETRVGIGCGAGIEYALNERFGLLLGGDARFLPAKPTAHWFKLFGGVTYRIK